MPLSHRPLTVGDLGELSRVLRGQSGGNSVPRLPSTYLSISGLAEELLAQLTSILSTGCLRAAAVQNCKGEIVGFGASVFVRDEFFEHCQTGFAPNLANQ